jgi:hypothetical protein
LHDSHRNILQAPVPVGFNTRQLYVNGHRAQRTRLVLQQNPPGNPALGGGAVASPDGYDINIENMTQWTNVGDIEAVMSSWWTQKRCALSAVSVGHIAVVNPCWTLANATKRITAMNKGLNWIENAYAFLNEPGQWYLDRSAHVIYYIPRAGEDLKTATVVAGQADQLIVGAGTLDRSGRAQFVENIAFEGLTFAYTTWLQPSSPVGFPEVQSGVFSDSLHESAASGHRITSAVSWSRASNIFFSGNRFVHLGGAGINFDTGSQRITVEGNVFADLAAGGITVGDPYDFRETDVLKQSNNHTIDNNFITDTGLDYPGTSAILVFSTANTVLAHNEIANAPYTGLSLGWFGSPTYSANNEVNHNYIHDVMQTLFDGGAIYTLSSGSGTRLKGNVLRDIGTKGKCATPSHPGGYAGYAAIYHDNGGAEYADSENVIGEVFCSGYWVFLQDDDVGITLQHNFVQHDLVSCPDHTGGPSNCLNGKGTNVTNLAVVDPIDNAVTREIEATAGLEAQYQHLKSERLPM